MALKNIKSAPIGQYYDFVKPWMVDYIRPGANVILDIGCGTGHLGKILRANNKASEIIGIEIFEDAANEAAKYYTKIYNYDIEKLTINYCRYFDYIICGDILEHLRDPWSVLSSIHKWLKDDGSLLISIPNLKHWRILKNLLFRDAFDYTTAGILDITHLRFFTRTTAFKMLNMCNYEIIKHEMDISGRKEKMMNHITISLFDSFLGSQIMIVAKKQCLK